VLATNAAWDRLAELEPGHPGADASELAILDALPHGGRKAHAVARGMRAVLAGTRNGFRAEYRHDHAGAERWFSLTVARTHTGGTMRVVVRREEIAAPSAPVSRDATGGPPEPAPTGDREARAWMARVDDALRNRFTLVTQPIIAVRGRHVIQHELLLRLRDDTGALTAPGSFLRAAEQCGKIEAIDRWVIREGIAVATRTAQRVAINVSAVTLSRPGVADYVERELRFCGADPALITFEVTETAVMSDERAAGAFLARVRSLGSRVALDDFGAGYGGFRYVKRLPVDVLKIDVEFVRDLPGDVPSRRVVEAITTLARSFGLETIAEGVEDLAAIDVLETLGVDYAQGYAIGRPAPLGEPAPA
jgi:EAL domain-containing protein (putative c-di-GMP-specific phosphodiesterase class I)